MSDTQRTVAGLVLCFLAIIVYFNVLSMVRGPQEPAPEEPSPTRPAPTEIGPTRPAPQAPPTSEPAQAITERPKPSPKIEPLPELLKVKTVECETSNRFRVALVNRGAAIKSVTLLDYYTFPEDDPKPGQGDLRLITEIEKGKLSLTMEEPNGPVDLEKAVWEHVPSPEVPEGFSEVVEFRMPLPDRSLEIRKTFLFREPEGENGGEHLGRDIELRVTVENHGNAPVKFKYALRSAAGIVPEPELPDPKVQPADSLPQRQSRDVEAVVGGVAGDEAKLDTYSAGKAPRRHSRAEAKPIYAGVMSRYFAAVLKPLSEDEITGVRVEKIGEHNVTVVLEILTEAVPAGEARTKRFMFLIAPRMPEVLRAYTGHRFEALLDYGWLGPIKKVLTWLLQVFYKVIPNYGLAIVLLTLCVRVILHPLTLKSQKSAHRMQTIQPLVSAAKEKYKHDKRLQQQEVMKVMREHGANPVGGCLPMLLQLPIFIGLWRSLYANPSLRHAPFMLWINDLSKADNLFSLGSALPIIGRSFNLLPLLCAAVMVVQQKLTPKSQDPQAQQTQKMMMFMPIFFAFLLYGMPSGLMVYFLCSSVFGVAEQRFIRRRLDAAALASEPEPSSVPVEQKRQKPAPQRRKKRRRR